MIDFYLHEDPVEAAGLVPPKNYNLAIIQAAQALSAVWCKLNPELLTMDLKRDPVQLPEMGAWRYVGFGDNLRIYYAGTWGGSSAAVPWLCQYGGNYDWLYKHAVELCALCKVVNKRRANVLQPVIRALELCPPSLMETLGTYSDFKELA